MVNTVETLKGKIALVTGASRGIGAAVALSLAGAGAAVAVNFRERSRTRYQIKLEDIAEALRGYGRMTTSFALEGSANFTPRS
jgi:NAD(P)-dependent dehydrogenase (short-subunit alcohol dehydrogenase family)